MYLVDNIPTLGTGKLDLRAVRAKAIELSAARAVETMEEENVHAF
jgi:hypothetical protein